MILWPEYFGFKSGDFFLVRAENEKNIISIRAKNLKCQHFNFLILCEEYFGFKSGAFLLVRAENEENMILIRTNNLKYHDLIIF